MPTTARKKAAFLLIKTGETPALMTRRDAPEARSVRQLGYRSRKKRMIDDSPSQSSGITGVFPAERAAGCGEVTR